MRIFMLIWVLMLAGMGTGYAQELESLPPAPADVQATMPPKAISLMFGKYPIGPNYREVLVHIYVVPLVKTAWSTQKSEMIGPNFTREDFLGGLNVPESRFTADFLQQDGSKLKRLNRVYFQSVDPVNAILIRWLQPNARRGPIVVLHTGVTHWLGWQLIVFPKGVQSTPTLQTFLFGGEGDTGSIVRLDAVDRHGRMRVREDWSRGEKEGVKRYPWDGVEFADRYRPYFVIAASVKTRAEAEAYVQHHKGGEEGLVIRPSSHYSQLRPGYFIVIAARSEKQKGADDYEKYLRKKGTNCYVKRAF